MKKRTVMILASAMLAGSLLATGAQARGGGGGHMGGGGGSHMEGGFGDHTGGGNHMGAGMDWHMHGYGGGLYDDEGLNCSNWEYARMHPECS
jgi:hypothetical protein